MERKKPHSFIDMLSEITMIMTIVFIFVAITITIGYLIEKLL